MEPGTGFFPDMIDKKDQRELRTLHAQISMEADDRQVDSRQLG